MTRKPKRRKKRITTGSLKKRAWNIFSRIVRQLHTDHRGYTQCVTCGKDDHWKNLQAGHFIPKSRGTAIYFEWSNVHPQCERCNIWEKEYAKIQYVKWMREHYGEGEIERLEQLARTRMKISKSDYLEMIERFKQIEKEIEP